VNDIIDIHPHVLSDDAAAYPLAPVGGKMSGWSKSRPVTAERLIEEMDANGITQAALVQASTAYGYDNRYVLDTAARYPDRFVAVGCADPLAADAARTVAEAGETPKFCGIRLFTTGSTMPGQSLALNDEATFPFWAAAQKAKVPVCVQMRLTARDELIDVLQRFPEAVVVLDHMAYPPIEPGGEESAFEQIEPLAKHQLLYLKMTVRNTEPLAGCDAGKFLIPLFQAFGSGRIAWGSNFPAAEQPMRELVDLVDSALAQVPEADRRNVLRDTARTLYPALG
jgi:predicted TIM-barrel fold metal-dependent hydrolase